jgi:hypothetical protein
MAFRLAASVRHTRRDTERFYLLPGMGGRARRQKVKQMAVWGVMGGLITSLLVGVTLYLINHFSERGH